MIFNFSKYAIDNLSASLNSFKSHFNGKFILQIIENEILIIIYIRNQYGLRINRK